MRNPSKIQYVSNPRHGNFEVPKTKNVLNINTLAANYKDRLEYEKYMNPKGIKPTITSRFTKPAQEIEFLNH